jgi:glutamyl aminopeptidase
MYKKKQRLLRETIIDLACRLQDSECLNKVTKLWDSVETNILSGNYDNSIIPPFVREIVFNYHIQNTYNLNDWKLLFLEYELNSDLNQQRKFLGSLTFSKLPWLLAKFIESQKEGGLRKVDFFEAIGLMSKNPIGRDLAWNYVRENYADILGEYGLEDTRVGRMLLDITSSFQDEFSYEQARVLFINFYFRERFLKNVKKF